MKTSGMLALLFVTTLTGMAQPPPPNLAGGPDQNRPGPWDNDVLVYRIMPGSEPEHLGTFARAGVPTVARLKDGRLIAAFQNFPADDERNFDRVAVRFSRDEGRTWSKAEPIIVDGMDAGLARPFDPTLMPLPDGRVRLYFTSNRSPDFRRSTPAIYSAISTDGVRYAFEPGARFGVEGRIVIDCAAALHDGMFHLIVPDNGATGDFMGGQERREPPRGGTGYHAISKDGLNFERVADVKLPSARGRWLGNMQSDGGSLVFFGTGPGLWPVSSKDGVTWETGSAPTRVPGADPGAVKLSDGSWLLLVTGEPRSGTPSARQRGNLRDRSPGERPGQAGGKRFQDFGERPMPPVSGPRDQGFDGARPGQQSPGGSSPREHQVLSATSIDGLTWTRDEGIRLSSASVPCAINDGDRRVLLYVVRPPDEPGGIGGVSCAVSTNGTDFTIAREFRIEGLSSRTAADPSIVRDSNGKFHLYYLASNHPGDPASGENPHQINFALSDDGLCFREAGTAFSYDNLVDPDVFHFQDRWFMYVFAGRGTVIASSADGLNFQYLGEMSPRDWGTTAAVPLPNGRLRLYAFEQRVPIGNAVRSFLSTNGVDWIAEPGVRLQAAANQQITDPFVIPWHGGWKMYFKTATAPRRPRQGDAAAFADEPNRAAGQAPLRRANGRQEGNFPQFESNFVRIPSTAAGTEGVAASILIPPQPRFTNGAPVVINVTGGVQAGSARGRPEYVAHGFVEIHFAFPGGGVGDERSGGMYDFRGSNCIRALADVIRFATGRIADKDGRRIGEVGGGVKVLTNNVGIVGSSHGGNACGMAMALHGEEFPELAWYASMESPYGEGAANVELGGRESGLNPAYDPKTGGLDLSKLAWSSELSPGLMRKPMLVNTRELKGALFFDLDGDGRFSAKDDFPANCFVGDTGGGVKAWYSPRFLAEAEKRTLIPDPRPRHVPTLTEAKEFWRCRDAAPSIPEAVRKCPNVAVIVYANEQDHVQADPAHTHILAQVEGFRAAETKFVRLNPDRAYVERVLPPGGRFARGLPFADNPAGKTWTRGNIAEASEPSELPLGIYMQAAVCELADRSWFGNWTVNLDATLHSGAPGRPLRQPGAALDSNRTGNRP